jgi:hypothetical protein
MALRGTLEDFGISEMLQLIGQQGKSGVLHLKRKGEEIHLHFADGCVVSAEYAGRKQRDRLGAMLVRAGLVERADLERALEGQRRTLRRLGDLLVDMGLVALADLRELAALQITETVYGLFTWKTGTYAFEARPVEWDRSAVTPLRADSALMEGFRRVDEWPMLRRTITSPAMMFLPAASAVEPGRAGGDALGPSERRVLALAQPGRTVERIVDLGRLGEFETCKALLTLVNLGYLEPVAPLRRSAAGGVSAYARGWRERLGRGAARVAATVALAAVLAGVAWVGRERSAAAARAPAVVDGRAARRFLARSALAQLSAALDVYRLEHGEYPARLDALVGAGLVRAADLRGPFGEDYHYRRKAEGGFVLLPPLP